MTVQSLDRSGVTRVVEKVIEAHGGRERWERVTTVELRLSSGGLAFAAKGQPRALSDVKATVATGRQSIDLTGSTPRPWRARFDEADSAGDADTVALDDELAALRQGRRRLTWSATDVGTFAAAALWTYVQVPFVLADPAVEVETTGPWTEAGQTWLRLAVRFPDGMATHCRRQVLYVDDDHRVRRHDYTAVAFGRWARAAQYLSDYQDCDGLSFPTCRRVYPRLPGGRRVRWPQLVWIDVHEVALHGR